MGENWTASSVSEDNVVMVWQPTQRVWAGDETKIDESELEADAMEGVESTSASGGPAGKASTANGSVSRSESMSISATASVSGADADEEDA